MPAGKRLLVYGGAAVGVVVLVLYLRRRSQVAAAAKQSAALQASTAGLTPLDSSAGTLWNDPTPGVGSQPPATTKTTSTATPRLSVDPPPKGGLPEGGILAKGIKTA